MIGVSELLDRLAAADVRLTVRAGQLEYDAPKGALDEDLVDELRAHKPELIEALQHPSPLAAAAVALAPIIRFHVSETEDVEGDVAFLRRVRLLLNKHPGSNRVRLRIRTLDCRRPLLEWQALATTELRLALGRLLAERGMEPRPPASPAQAVATPPQLVSATRRPGCVAYAVNRTLSATR